MRSTCSTETTRKQTASKQQHRQALMSQQTAATHSNTQHSTAMTEAKHTDLVEGGRGPVGVLVEVLAGALAFVVGCLEGVIAGTGGRLLCTCKAYIYIYIYMRIVNYHSICVVFLQKKLKHQKADINIYIYIYHRVSEKHIQYPIGAHAVCVYIYMCVLYM